MLEKILLDVAMLNAHPVHDNNSEVFQNLAAVCCLWKDIVDSDHFCMMFRNRLRSVCELIRRAMLCFFYKYANIFIDNFNLNYFIKVIFKYYRQH